MIGEIIGILAICLLALGVPAIGMWLLLQLLNESEWISTSDRLPSDTQRVMFYTVFQSYEVGVYDGVEWCGDGWYERSEVTHWRYLPPPPKGV